MKRIIFAPLFVLTLLLLTSCDDGRIFPEEISTPDGRTVTMEGTLTGIENWPTNYWISLAGFENADDEYAAVLKVISKNDVADGKVAIELSGIKSEVKTVRLCVLNRLRKHIVTFKEIDLSNVSEATKMDVGTVDVSMLNAIQQSYLSTTCANCHGASNRAAAGLYLTEGRSYEALVGKPSTKVEGKNLVEPFDAANSVLHMVLNQQSVEGISMDHRDLVSEKNEQSILPLIDAWINNGAKEN